MKAASPLAVSDYFSFSPNPTICETTSIAVLVLKCRLHGDDSAKSYPLQHLQKGNKKVLAEIKTKARKPAVK